MNSNLRYKNLDLSLQFYYNGGNYIYNQMYRNAVGDGGNASSLAINQFTDALNYWTKPGDVVANPSLTDASQKVNLASDKFLEKGDYITLRDVVVGYTLPSALPVNYVSAVSVSMCREPICGQVPNSEVRLK